MVFSVAWFADAKVESAAVTSCESAWLFSPARVSNRPSVVGHAAGSWFGATNPRRYARHAISRSSWASEAAHEAYVAKAGGFSGLTGGTSCWATSCRLPAPLDLTA